jgi:hypothetical protein
VWNDEETLVRNEMKALLSGKLTEEVTEELSDVLFGILYPTYVKKKDA